MRVGAQETYATLSAAVGAAHDGDVILVDAGTYENDFATVTAKITIMGVGGMANFIATEPPPNLKGILTVDNDVTIANLSFSGSAISDADGGNGAGIRYEGGQMSLINDAFSNNQDGLLAAPVLPQLTTNTITIDHSVFSDNGSGSGYTHNLYVGDVSSLTVTNSVFEGAIVGHEFKSRANATTLTNNVFRDGPAGTASYSIDLPNGGHDVVTGNLIEKGPDSENNASVHFGGEGIPYAASSLTLSGNDFVNDLGSTAVAVLNQTPITVSITGNTFSGYTASQIANGPAMEAGNVAADGMGYPDNTLVGVLPGSTLVITDDAPHSVTLDNSLQAVEGGGGLLTAYAAGGHVVAIGGPGGLDFAESPTSGGNTVTTASGSTNTLELVGQDLIDSEGHDTITTGWGNVTGQIDGTATIAEGYANNQWSVNGTATIKGGGGNPAVSVGPQGSATITGPLNYLGLTVNGGHASFDVTEGGAEESATITGGAVTVRVDSGTMAFITAGGLVGSTITLGEGTALVTSLGADTIQAGSGSDSVIVSGKATIQAGTGTLSVFGRSDVAGASIYGNGGSIVLDGDTGNLTYFGGSKASTVALRLDNNTLIGGTGHMTVNGGSRETITGGSGGLTYTATDGGGANTITTAAGASDTLQLAGADTVQSWGNDTISGGTGNQTIIVQGNSVIQGSTGNSSVTLSGTDVFTGIGQDHITVTAGAVATITAGSQTSIDETNATVNFSVSGGATATVKGGSASLTETPQQGIAISTGRGSPSTIHLGGGTDTVASQASDTVFAGSGADTIMINVANTTVWGGSGTLAVHDNDGRAGDKVTVHGGSGALTYDQGPGALTFIGNSGSAVIDGEYGSLNVTAGSGQITVRGGSAGTVFTAGTGKANVTLTTSGGTVVFGGGATTVQVGAYGPGAVFDFNVGHGGGVDVISGFRAGIDQLVFNKVSAKSVTAMQGGYIVKLTDGTTLDLLHAALPSFLQAMIRH